MCGEVPGRVVLERGATPLAAEVHPPAVVVDVRRPLGGGHGHAAHRVDRRCEHLVGATTRTDTVCSRAARRRSARGSRARSPRGCARRCRARPASPAPPGAPAPCPRRAARPPRRRRARGWPRAPRRAGRPPARGAARAARRARARPPPGRGRPRAARPRAGPVTSRSSSAPSRATAAAIGVSPTTSTRGEASIGSRKISSDPPDRHGFCTVTAPSAAGASSSPGRMRSSSASPVSSARSACRRTLCSAHAPPTKPSIVPSPSTIAASPVRTLVGRCARTTVATTNGVRAARRSSARRLRLAPIITTAYRPARVGGGGFGASGPPRTGHEAQQLARGADARRVVVGQRRPGARPAVVGSRQAQHLDAQAVVAIAVAQRASRAGAGSRSAAGRHSRRGAPSAPCSAGPSRRGRGACRCRARRCRRCRGWPGTRRARRPGTDRARGSRRRPGRRRRSGRAARRPSGRRTRRRWRRR